MSNINQTLSNQVLPEEYVKGFLKQSQDLGLPEPFAQGILKELGLQKQSNVLHKEAEMNFLSNIRKHLVKQGAPDSVLKSTVSMEAFQKAAEEESSQFCKAFTEELTKAGYDKSFGEGILREAQDRLEKVAGEFEGIVNAFRETNPARLAQSARFVRGPGEAVGGGLRKIFGLGRTADQAMSLGPGIAPEVAGRVQSGAIRQRFGSLLSGIDSNSWVPGARQIRDWGAGISASGENAGLAQGQRLTGKMLGQAVDDSTSSIHNFRQTHGFGENVNAQPVQADYNALDAVAKAKVESGPAGSIDNNVAQKIQDKTTGALEQDAQGQAMSPTRASASYKAGPGGGGSGLGSFIPRFTPGRGVVGAGIGGLALSPLGPVAATIGAGIGGAAGTFGALPTAIGLGAGAAVGGHKLFKSLTGGPGNEPDITGAPADRNRILPFAGNQWVGAAGGYMLAHAIATELGVSGPAAMILALLGGAAGYKFLPSMVNQYSDPRGYGVNKTPDFVTRQMPGPAR